MFLDKWFGKKEKGTKNNGKDVPAIAKKYNIRVSTPYGLFPQDVEAVLENLEKEKNTALELNEKVNQENQKLLMDIKDLQAVVTQLKFDMSLYEIPESTDAQDFMNLNKIRLIKNKGVDDDFGIDIVDI